MKGVLWSFVEVWGIFYDRADQKTNHSCGLYFKCTGIILILGEEGRPSVCHGFDSFPLPHLQPSSCLFKEAIDVLEKLL